MIALTTNKHAHLAVDVGNVRIRVVGMQLLHCCLVNACAVHNDAAYVFVAEIFDRRRQVCPDARSVHSTFNVDQPPEPDTARTGHQYVEEVLLRVVRTSPAIRLLLIIMGRRLAVGAPTMMSMPKRPCRSRM